jgi:hypothetical protein
VKKFDVACHVGYDLLQEVGASPDELERILDQHEVAKAVLLPMGAGLIHRFREQNRELAQLSAGSSRYLFFCTVNPWFGAEALEELDLCFRQLGAAGLAFDTSRQGLYIDSPMIFPFIEAARELAKPVYFFTGVPLFALPLNLANLARRFPEVRFIMGAMGVSDYWGDIVPSVRLAPNIYLETSVNTNVPAVLPSFVEEFGDRSILFGSNYPYTDYEMEYRKIERAGLPPDSLERIFFRNACGLFGISL